MKTEGYFEGQTIEAPLGAGDDVYYERPNDEEKVVSGGWISRLGENQNVPSHEALWEELRRNLDIEPVLETPQQDPSLELFQSEQGESMPEPRILGGGVNREAFVASVENAANDNQFLHRSNDTVGK